MLNRASNPARRAKGHDSSPRKKKGRQSRLFFQRAEGAGFEPADRFYPVNTLAVCCIRPLCHPSLIQLRCTQSITDKEAFLVAFLH